MKFLQGTRAELKHVTWPTRTRAFAYTAIIIICSAALGYLLGGFDALFRELLKLLVVA